MTGALPASRLRALNRGPENPAGAYILYWMTACRRPGWSFALQHAAAQARRLGRPLLVCETLACDEPWASDRLHGFVLAGMAANARAFARAGVAYYPYVEPRAGAATELLAALAARACRVVADDAPLFSLPRLLAAAAPRLTVKLEAIDGCTLLPRQIADHDYPSAYAFRRLLHKELPPHLLLLPEADPLHDLPGPPAVVPAPVAARWPATPRADLEQPQALLARLPIDHGVAPVAAVPGGHEAAAARLQEFVAARLPRYAAARNQPQADVTSGLSPYLHCGQIAPHAVFAAVAAAEGWEPGRLAPGGRGQRQGWWGMSENAEAFLDQLVTWRELGYNFATFRSDGGAFDSLPGWCRATLENHADDPRPFVYSRDQFAAAATHDPLWNAAQRQLRREGIIHNYLRMLWGKKILEWSASPQEALATMLDLNNRYALDGRDPNSDSGIFWCLGRYDRPWGPERPVFGTIRFMSSANTARKVEIRDYLARYAP